MYISILITNACNWIYIDFYLLVTGLHDVLIYKLAAVLQFVMTREHALLRLAIEQLNKVPLKEERGPQERMHLKSLYCKVENEEGSQELTFLQSFLTPIQKWADKQLADYHLNFSEVSIFFIYFFQNAC